MKDAGLSNSQASARHFDATDEQLSAELKNWTGASPALHPVGELFDRHWEAAFAYARLCTDGERAAGMLTTAAFTRLFGDSLRQDGPTAAWRPHLLVTVRRTAAEWDADGRRQLLHPVLRAQEGDGERLAARLLPPVHRRLLSRAFQRLPQFSRCLLWHIEVEAEPLAAPAALLGLDEDGARVELRRAHERLREECLQVHHELVVDQDCRRYHRLLDVTCRRGGIDVDPDLRAHLAQCRHCAHTADQLQRFEDGSLGPALAEGVLGWGAQAYVASRTAPAEETAADAGASAGEATAPASPPGTVAVADTRRPARTARSVAGGRRRPGRTGPGSTPQATRRAAQKAARRARRRNLVAAVLTVSGLIVLPLVVWSSLGSGDGDTRSSGGQASQQPGTGTGTAASGPSWTGAGEDAEGTLKGRLRNAASGLCIGIAGRKAVAGAETELVTCSAVAGQQWSYDPDGLLRSGENPDLCLDSHLGYSVRLAPCAGASRPTAKNVRYDFTLQGTLVPRWDQDLALAPAATDGSGALVAKNRDQTAPQRWVIDTSQPDPQMQIVNWGARTGAPTPTPTPKSAQTPTSSSTPPPSRPTATSTPAPSGTPTCSSSYPYPCSGWGNGSGGGDHDSGGSGYGGHDSGSGGGRH